MFSLSNHCLCLDHCVDKHCTTGVYLLSDSDMTNIHKREPCADKANCNRSHPSQLSTRRPERTWGGVRWEADVRRRVKLHTSFPKQPPTGLMCVINREGRPWIDTRARRALDERQWNHKSRPTNDKNLAAEQSGGPVEALIQSRLSAITMMGS